MNEQAPSQGRFLRSVYGQAPRFLKFAAAGIDLPHFPGWCRG
jgi:hypothetical protein